MDKIQDYKKYVIEIKDTIDFIEQNLPKFYMLIEDIYLLLNDSLDYKLFNTDNIKCDEFSDVSVAILHDIIDNFNYIYLDCFNKDLILLKKCEDALVFYELLSEYYDQLNDSKYKKIQNKVSEKLDELIKVFEAKCVPSIELLSEIEQLFLDSEKQIEFFPYYVTLYSIANSEDDD